MQKKINYLVPLKKATTLIQFLESMQTDFSLNELNYIQLTREDSISLRYPEVQLCSINLISPMDLQDFLKESLHERDSSKRLTYRLQACKKFSSQLPFPSFISKLQSRPLTLKYILISSQKYKGNLEMLYQALQDRYSDDPNFIILYFDTCTKIMIDQENYCDEVNKNRECLLEFLLGNTKTFVASFYNSFLDHKQILTKVNNFYKQYVKYTTKYELLNQCFSDALELREKWSQLKESDPYFEQDFEEQLVQFSNLSQKNLEAFCSPMQEKDREEPSSARMISKKELKLQLIENWLFMPTEMPILSPPSGASVDQLGCEMFKSKFALEAIISFVLLPTKFECSSQYTLKNVQVDLEQPKGPTFRQYNVQIDPEKRPQIQFRAFRAMQALTDSKNHFFITQANKDYYIKAFTLLYESLKHDLVAITICPEILVQYLTFLLYQESDIAVYFFLYYNIPYRLLLFIDIEAVSQFMTQFVKFSLTPYNKLPQDSSELIWKYLNLSNFFGDLMKSTLFDDKVLTEIINVKSAETYKPEGLNLQMPSLTPLHQEKVLPAVEQKKIVEEMETVAYDIDLCVSIVQGKTLKAVRLFQKMIDSSQLQMQIQEKLTRKRMTLQAPRHLTQIEVSHAGTFPLSPMRRKTVLAPKLQSLLERSQTQSAVQIRTEIDQSSTGRAKNLFSILESTIIDVAQTPESPKPVYQRLLRRQPSKLIQIHTRSLSNNYRNSRIGSQMNQGSHTVKTSSSSRTTASRMVNRFNHLVGQIAEIQQDLPLYPPELKSFQLEDLETLAFDKEFQKNCQANERYTKGALAVIYDLVTVLTTSLLKDSSQLMMLKSKWAMMSKNDEEFFDVIRKNYLLKQQTTEDYDCTYVIAGKIYNSMIRKNSVTQCRFFNLEQDLVLIVKILLSVLMNSRIKARGILLLESVVLIIESSRGRYLLHIPTTFWHLVFEQFGNFRRNQMYGALVNRMIGLAFMYGSQIVLNRIIMKINCFAYVREFPQEVVYMVKVLWVALRHREKDLKTLKSQMGLLSSWNSLIEFHKKRLDQIDHTAMEENLHQLRLEDLGTSKGAKKTRQ